MSVTKYFYLHHVGHITSLSPFFPVLGIFISTEFCLLLMLHAIGLLAALLVITYCYLQHGCHYLCYFVTLSLFLGALGNVIYTAFLIIIGSLLTLAIIRLSASNMVIYNLLITI